MVRVAQRARERWTMSKSAVRYFAKLTRAKVEPEKYSMPVCHRHIEALAVSIRLRGLTESVLVLVEPGIVDADRICPNMFCCYLCQLYGIQREGS